MSAMTSIGRVDHLHLDGAGVGHRLLEHRPLRVRHGEPRADHPQRPEPRVGQHLVDRRVVPTGDEQVGACRGSAPRGRRRPRRPAGPGCPDAGRTAAGSARRPWSGPARAAARPSTRRSGSPSSRATAKPPLRTSSTPQRSGARSRRRRRRHPARRRTAASKGSGATNVDPSAADAGQPRRRPARAPWPPCRSAKFVTHRSNRSAGTRRPSPGDGSPEPARAAVPSAASCRACSSCLLALALLSGSWRGGDVATTAAPLAPARRPATDGSVRASAPADGVRRPATAGAPRPLGHRLLHRLGGRTTTRSSPGRTSPTYRHLSPCPHDGRVVEPRSSYRRASWASRLWLSCVRPTAS